MEASQKHAQLLCTGSSQRVKQKSVCQSKQVASSRQKVTQSDICVILIGWRFNLTLIEIGKLLKLARITLCVRDNTA